MQTKYVSWEENLKNGGNGPFVKFGKIITHITSTWVKRSRIGVEGVVKTVVKF